LNVVIYAFERPIPWPLLASLSYQEDLRMTKVPAFGFTDRPSDDQPVHGTLIPTRSGPTQSIGSWEVRLRALSVTHPRWH